MDNNILKVLLKEINKAYKRDEIPVGCVIVKNNKIISKSHNTKTKSHRCIDHAEIKAITKAEKKLKDWRLNECDMYVSLEPCSMCKEVIKASRIAHVNYLLKSNFTNEDGKEINYKEIKCDSKIREEYLTKLKSFFVNKR